MEKAGPRKKIDWSFWGFLAMGALVSFFVVFALYKNAESEDQKKLDRENYIRQETTCQLSDGVMIDDICYKSDKLEVIEVG